jgi:hypothetical protein
MYHAIASVLLGDYAQTEKEEWITGREEKGPAI